MRTTHTMTVSLPPAMIKELEKVRRSESRTRSELVREALRRYFESRYRVLEPSASELVAINQGRAAFTRGDSQSGDQFFHDLESTNRRTRAKRSAKTAGKRSMSR
jgi:Arc/MetJ-type ribon-helix-helix transcriptional regulator